MLYQFRELQRSMLSPWLDSSHQAAKLLRDPLNPFSLNPFAPAWAAALELFYRVGREYPKPPFGLGTTTVEGKTVAVSERVVVDKPFCKLVRFERAVPAGRAADPKVLVFAPLSGHYATLLRDTVRSLLPEHDVYITDWVNAREVPVAVGRFGLDEYVQYSVDFMRHLGADTHVLAVCQPTVPVLAAIAVMSERKDPAVPKTVTLMGGPIDPRESPTQVNTLATERDFRWFEENLIFTVPPGFEGAGRRVYPGFMQHFAFVSMNPRRHFKSHWDFFMDLVKGDEDSAAAHRDFYDEYNAVLDMTAEYYLETIKTVFQDHALPHGTMQVVVDGTKQLVDCSKITVPALFTVEGENDDITGPGQSEAALALCSGIPEARKRHFVAQGAGHYGIFSGRKWREVIAPQLHGFIRSFA